MWSGVGEGSAHATTTSALEMQMIAKLCSTLDEEAEHGRRATHVGHTVRVDGLEDCVGCDLSEAYVGTAHASHRPRKAPAVAVKQWQGPKIDGLTSQTVVHDLPKRVELGPLPSARRG